MIRIGCLSLFALVACWAILPPVVALIITLIAFLLGIRDDD